MPWMAGHAGYLNVVDVLDRIRSPGILCNGSIGIVDLTGFFIVDNILQYGAVADGSINVRFVFSG